MWEYDVEITVLRTEKYGDIEPQKGGRALFILASAAEVVSIGFGLTLLYVSYLVWFSNDRYVALSSKRSLLLHALFAGVVAVFGVVRMVQTKGAFLDDFFFFSPLCYLGAVLLADTFIQHKYERPILFAHKYNMTEATQAGATYVDYSFFIFIHLLPFLMPLFIHSTLLGFS